MSNKTKDQPISEIDQLRRLIDDLSSQAASCKQLAEQFKADLTKSKQAEEELRFHSEVMKNMAEGVYLVSAESGMIIWANPKFEEMFGYGAGEMNGQHVSIVNAPTDKDPTETAREIMDVLNKTGHWHGEVNNIKKNGTSFWCYANCSVFKHSEHGRVIVSVHTDITEHKRADENLKQEAIMRSRLLDNLPCIAMILKK